jgi:hypothetical protein
MAIGSRGCKWQPKIFHLSLDRVSRQRPSWSSALILASSAHWQAPAPDFESHWLKMEATVADSASTL